MNLTPPTTDTDPSGLFGMVGTLVGSVLALLVLLGVIDGEVADAVLAVVMAALPLVTAFAIRRYAWAPSTVRVQQRLVEARMAARYTGQRPTEEASTAGDLFPEGDDL